MMIIFNFPRLYFDLVIILESKIKMNLRVAMKLYFKSKRLSLGRASHAMSIIIFEITVMSFKCKAANTFAVDTGAILKR